MSKNLSFKTEGTAHFLVIVEVMLHALHILIRLVALAGNENHVARLRQHHRRTDGLAPVANAQRLRLLLLVESGQHVVDDVLRIFEARIIARNDYAVGTLGSLSSNCLRLPRVLMLGLPSRWKRM